MKFGVMIRGQCWLDDDMPAYFQDAMEQARLAQSLGFSSIAKGSHYSVRPLQDLQQLIFLTRVMTEAPDLQLIAGVVLVPLHKPLDLAEQLATIDVMSGGRLVFGAGLGYREVEFKAFGTDQKDRVRRMEENLIAIKRLWTEDTVDMVGSHFELAGAACSTKPVQRPHPPIWIGANADAAIRRAARLGDCWFINPHQQFGTINRQLDVYKAALDDAGKPMPEGLPAMREVFVADSREQAVERCKPYLEARYRVYQSWEQDKAMPADDNSLDLDFDDLIDGRFIIGSPDEVVEQIVEHARVAHVNHLVMGLHWPGMPQAMALETMHRIAEEVMPRVREAL
ncbi:MAG: LLM class flavin-dependent oxidoreductase [Alphaproteobacteria bacterium]|nr:LLM class flavin-dependent oxidoreductase [Alphaproteobacteria bacterium]